MATYGKQVILLLLDGGAGDAVLHENADRLMNKESDPLEALSAMFGGPAFTSTRVTYYKGGRGSVLTKAIGKLTADDRLYILGHGRGASQLVGGLSGADCAKLLADSGLTAIKRISVVGCWSAGVSAIYPLPPVTLADVPARTFAQKLHWDLLKLHNVFTEVAARVTRVSVRHDGIKRTRSGAPDDTGRPGQQIWRQPRTKVIYRWVNGNQDLSFAY
jgi:Peptidase C80 family